MKVSITLTPAVAILNRKQGSYGIGEVINLAVIVTPLAPGLAGIAGGVVYKVTKGSGTISGAIPGAGTAIFTASGKSEEVTISAYAGASPGQALANAGLKIIAPTDLKFVINSNVHHNNGAADCGFRGQIFLQPPGVSYQRLDVREGTFKGKGSGYYAAQDGMEHPATALPANVVNGNQVNGFDTIYSGIQGTPYSAGKFEWNIPWQYRITGTAQWITFAYANHVQEINALGAVSIGKYNAGPFKASVNDPTQAY